MRDIIIYGAGGFGRETALMIRQINEKGRTWNILGFCDDHVKKGVTVDGLAVVGGLDYMDGLSRETAVAIAVAEPSIRRKIRNGIRNQNVHYPVLVHPSVLSGDSERNRIEEGTIITAGNILTTGIHIKSFVTINLSCTIGHDVTINEFSSIMPGCSLSGGVIIESEVMVGTGAKILQGLIISHQSRVGAGAVVTRNVPPGTTVVGVPARAMS